MFLSYIHTNGRNSMKEEKDKVEKKKEEEGRNRGRRRNKEGEKLLEVMDAFEA